MESDQSKAISECTIKYWCYEFQYEWTVKNFSLLTTPIQSPEFQVELAGDSSKWRIELYPYRDEEEEDFLELFVEIVDTKLNNLVVDGECILLNAFGSQITSDSLIKNSEVNNCYTFQHDIKREKILRDISYDDNLKIISKIIVSNSPTPILKLQSSTKSLIEGDFSDITILIGEREFFAHKNILAAQSSVFSAMFKTEMEEAKSGKVKIEDIEPEIFEELLKYIYTGDANLNDHACQLLAAADKYNIKNLKYLCEYALIQNVDIENCFKILFLSDLHSVEKLKVHTLNFIVSNIRKVDKEKLAEIKQPSLLKEIIEAFINL